MAHVNVRAEGIDLERPILVEGLPGVGLVGKIAADHLVDSLDMTYYAGVEDCEGLPRVAKYDTGDYTVRPPVRLYADEDRDLLVLQSDVPIPQAAADEFASCLSGWLADNRVLPVYLGGRPTGEKSTPPAMFGVATGAAAGRLEDAAIEGPPEEGVLSGPTGALLARAAADDFDAVGLVVESNQRFPDPEAARILLRDGVGPIADVEVPLDQLVEQAGEIREAKEQLAEQMQQAADAESTQAKPLRMYQ